MNNRIKSILIGIFFVAAIAAAYKAGIYSRDESPFPPAFPQTDAAPGPARALPGADEPRASQTVPDEMPIAGTPLTASVQTGGSQRINVEDYETLDGHNASDFRPDPYVLKQAFPDNLALPPTTREEFAEKQKQREQRNTAYGMIAANKASREEIEQYYGEQVRLAEDSIEILLFILTEYQDQMSETDLLKHEFLIERFQKRLDLIPERKAAALERLNK